VRDKSADVTSPCFKPEVVKNVRDDLGVGKLRANPDGGWNARANAEFGVPHAVFDQIEPKIAI
jgi:hypothetical protein